MGWPIAQFTHAEIDSAPTQEMTMNRNEKASERSSLFNASLKSAAVLALVASVLTGCATTGLDSEPAQSSFEDVHHGA